MVRGGSSHLGRTVESPAMRGLFFMPTAGGCERPVADVLSPRGNVPPRALGGNIWQANRCDRPLGNDVGATARHRSGVLEEFAFGNREWHAPPLRYATDTVE